MKHGSLFSGLGGFDLAAEWMGWENIFHCEWMEFPRKVLDYHFPNADSHIDICKTDFKKYANKIDILTGGFPCQPFSMAGKRKGTDDERYLWGEMLRAIQEIKPTFVIAENVAGILSIDDGLVFEQVCLDLEAEGYEVQPFVIPAAAKNAPHRRDRVWFVATNTNCNGLNQRNGNDEKHSSQGGVNAQRDTKQSDVDGNATDSHSNGLDKRWGYDGSSQNDERGNASKQWSADTKDANRCSSNGLFEKQPPTSSRVGKQANAQENKTTRANEICGVDKANHTQKIIGNNNDSINKSGALVQERCKRIFAPTNSRLEHNKTPFGKLATMGLSVDLSRINRMERYAPDTNSRRTQTRQDGEVLGESDTKGKARGFIYDGIQRDATNTNGFRQELPKKRHRSKNCQSLKSSQQLFELQPQGWQKFPTQPPICGRDDGLPTELDGITFPKWRAESIKGYGNAIVPQVALEIFKQLEKIYLEL